MYLIELRPEPGQEEAGGVALRWNIIHKQEHSFIYGPDCNLQIGQWACVLT